MTVVIVDDYKSDAIPKVLSIPDRLKKLNDRITLLFTAGPPKCGRNKVWGGCYYRFGVLVPAYIFLHIIIRGKKALIRKIKP